ncbi:MAG: ubiquitin-like protein Pup [Acidimicrobiia bacterium]|nr:ubiquitin-like protein Pup [Acidimicrobiia bacterium]NNF65591.1 ubiquitin-like protein Pup [Acidimicrobiia bacterium]
MSDRERKQTGRDTSDQEAATDETTEAVDAEDLTDRIDDILEEIDSVLEENAEEFVKNYVQKGGE